MTSPRRSVSPYSPRCRAIATAIGPFEAFVHGVAARKVADAQRALARHPLPTDDLPDEIDSEPDS